jgi:hypothetical protein
MAESNAISFRYSFTAREWREGVAILQKPPWSMPGTSRKEPLRHTVIGIAVGVAICALIVAPPPWAVSFFGERRGRQDAWGVAVAATVGIGVAWWIGSRWMFELAVFQRFRCWGNALYMSIDEGGLVERVPGATTTYGWTHFRGVAEGKRVLVLWTAIDRGFILPKRLFGDEAQVVAATAFLQMHAARRAVPVLDGFEVVQ